MPQPPSQRQGSPDDFQTPPEALDPVLPFLPASARIWEPACGKGNLAHALAGHGWDVVASDVLGPTAAPRALHGGRVYWSWQRSYLDWQPDAWDLSLTNPPYSLKNEFLARAYALGKPFAFLCPLTFLETRKRQDLFRRHGIEVVLMPHRINFETPSGQGTGAWFPTGWFTWGLGIGSALTFWEPAKAQPALALEAA